jgi:hypothetical protein
MFAREEMQNGTELRRMVECRIKKKSIYSICDMNAVRIMDSMWMHRNNKTLFGCECNVAMVGVETIEEAAEKE